MEGEALFKAAVMGAQCVRLSISIRSITTYGREGGKMKRHLASLIFFALVSIVLTHAPYARAEEDTGGAESGQKAVKEIEVDEARVIMRRRKGAPSS